MKFEKIYSQKLIQLKNDKNDLIKQTTLANELFLYNWRTQSEQNLMKISLNHQFSTKNFKF